MSIIDDTWAAINCGLDELRETLLAGQAFTLNRIVEMEKDEHPILFSMFNNPERCWDVSAKLPGEGGRIYSVWVAKQSDGSFYEETPYPEEPETE